MSARLTGQRGVSRIARPPAAFQAQRAHLRAVAYLMLGSFAEAHDAVQEAWLRLNRSGADQVRDLLDAFLSAARDGDFDGLVALLDPCRPVGDAPRSRSADNRCAVRGRDVGSRYTRKEVVLS